MKFTGSEVAIRASSRTIRQKVPFTAAGKVFLGLGVSLPARPTSSVPAARKVNSQETALETIDEPNEKAAVGCIRLEQTQSSPITHQ